MKSLLSLAVLLAPRIILLACFPTIALGSDSRRDANQRAYLSTRQTWQVGQTVQTSSGPVQGHAASGAVSVSEYLGIPYAQPPVGTLRFQPPVKFSSTAALNGSSFGFSCVGTNTSTLSFGGGGTSGRDKLGLTSAGQYLISSKDATATPEREDCLTLNVWTKPQTGEQKKAVMVFIHGGAFIQGSSSLSWYNGQLFADQEDVVLVTINYRLALFGFPGDPTAPANLGLLDQRMAVEWVRDNIAAFGGDPSRIIIFGESAGGASVDHYSYAWATDPIVSGFIAQSGTATSFGVSTASDAANIWFNLTAILGCGNRTSSSSSVTPASIHSCMLGKSAADISAAIPSSLTAARSDALLPFGPTVDGTLVFPEREYASTRSPAALPMLVGNTDNEIGLFRLLAPNAPEAIWPVIQQQRFTCPTAGRAAVAVAKGNPVWRYRYFGAFPNLELYTNPSSGAWHGSELPILFGTMPTKVIANTAAELEISAYMRNAWSTFAKDPVHGLEGLPASSGGGWPRYSAADRTLVRLAFENKTGPNLVAGNAYDRGCAALSGGGGATTTTTSSTNTATSAGGQATSTSTNAAAAAATPGALAAGGWVEVPLLSWLFVALLL